MRETGKEGSGPLSEGVCSAAPRGGRVWTRGWSQGRLPSWPRPLTHPSPETGFWEHADSLAGLPGWILCVDHVLLRESLCSEAVLLGCRARARAKAVVGGGGVQSGEYFHVGGRDLAQRGWNGCVGGRV